MTDSIMGPASFAFSQFTKSIQNLPQMRASAQCGDCIISLRRIARSADGLMSALRFGGVAMGQMTPRLEEWGFSP